MIMFKSPLQDGVVHIWENFLQRTSTFVVVGGDSGSMINLTSPWDLITINEPQEKGVGTF